tara:strand:+ start:812 stop:1114 length:303 start_codon:yes stop_codon:yes gene_type:complete
MTILSNVFGVLAQTLQIYSFILIIRILLSWFPNLDWSNPILTNITSITDPYLNIFRGIIPPLGGLDLSPLLAFLLLNVSESVINGIRFALLNSSVVDYYS